MWTERRSLFLLLRFGAAGKTGFVFPISLPLLAETVDVLADLALLGDLLFPGLTRRIGRRKGGEAPGREALSLSRIVRLVGGLLSELRRYGRWRMVDVEAGGSEISLDFY